MITMFGRTALRCCSGITVAIGCITFFKRQDMVVDGKLLKMNFQFTQDVLFFAEVHRSYDLVGSDPRRGGRDGQDEVVVGFQVLGFGDRSIS